MATIYPIKGLACSCTTLLLRCIRLMLGGALLLLPTDVHALTISELMYHPTPSPQDPPIVGEALEYIELYNKGPETEDLSGYALVDGVSYVFPQGTLLAPRSFLLVASNPDVLREFYAARGDDMGGAEVYGPYAGFLDNTGEALELRVEGGGRLIRMNYNDGGQWPAGADGTGHSLEILSPFYDPDEPESWEISKTLGGTPGKVGRFTIPTFDPVSNLPSIEWTKEGFDDSQWTPGTTPIGYDAEGVYSIATPVSDMQYNYTSLYLRIPFELSGPEGIEALSLEVFYDDGFVANLNEKEVGRSATVGGSQDIPLAYSAPCSNKSPEPTAYEAFDITAYADRLVSGRNWLAIQALNTSAGSSDFVISARLIGTWGGTDTVLVDEGADLVYFKGTKEPVPQQGNGEDTYHHTPGTHEHPPVVINEFLAATELPDAGDWIELYNRGEQPVEIGGVFLSDDADDLARFQIPAGVILDAGDHRLFTREELGFGFSSLGEKIFLTAADLSRVTDAVNYGAQAHAGVSYGRYPDGGEGWYFMPSLSPDGPNVVVLEDSIVINEIMYHPITKSGTDEYIELSNRGPNIVDLFGWRLSKAIDYTFTEHKLMSPGDYLVIARDPANIEQKYEITGVLGPYEGALANDGENVRLRDENDNPVDEVRYYDGGDWPDAADGEGSSLELIDPRDDNSVPAAWAASLESHKSSWTSFTHTSVHSNWWVQPESEFHIFLQHKGECLVDGLSFYGRGMEHLSNGSFESGTSGWLIEGTHVDSFVTDEDSVDGSRSLHIVSSGRGDTYCNRIETNTTSSLSVGQTYTITGQARWLRGSKWLNVRTHGQGIAKAVELSVPQKLGTPGAQNSVFASNRGPSITEAQHSPIVPAPGENATVTARVTDIDGVGSVELFYGVDGSGSFASRAMNETGGPGSGIYTAQIPGQSNGTLMAFYIRAIDQSGAGNTYPDNPAYRQCLYYVGAQRLSNLPVYRVLFPAKTAQELASRPRMSNHLLPCSFVYDETETYYQCWMRFRGSPFIRGSANPVYDKRAMRLRFSPDNPFHLRREINLDTMEPGRNPSLQSERVAYWICRKIGVPWSEIRFVRVMANQNDHGLYGDVQKVDEDYASFWFPGDDDGYLYKIDDWFEFTDSGGFSNRDADLRYWQNGNLSGWGDEKELYRWNYRTRSRDEEDSLQPIIDMVKAANAPDAQYVAAVSAIMDVEEVLKEIAVRHIVGDWDSWGYSRGKNNLLYQRPSDGRLVLIPWDIDFVLGSGDGPTGSLTGSGLYGFSRMFSAFGSLYDRILNDIARGPLAPGAADGYMDRTFELLSQEGVGVQSPDGIKSYLTARREFILGPAVAITTNGGMPLVTTDPNVVLTGSAPYDAETMTLNGEPVQPVWTSPTSWAISGAVSYGVNDFTVEVFDGQGNSLGSDQITITVNPFTIHTIRPEAQGTYLEWYSIPRREYSIIAGESLPPGTIIGMNIKADGPTLAYLDASAPFFSQRFYQVMVQPPKYESGLKGEYFTGMNFNTLRLTRVDNVVNFDWGDGSPGGGMPADQFSVRWTGFIVIEAAGTYTFWTNSDDGVRLRIGENTVVDNWTDHAPTWNSGSIVLSADEHTLRLEFYENGGGAVMQLEYQGPGIPRQTIPVNVLLHEPF
ncbi:MAG: lamin tail domain-containing protein [bacterium]|nr:lamin tail domain-containing protein [bacterium]